jgi:hypothetical protein
VGFLLDPFHHAQDGRGAPELWRKALQRFPHMRRRNGQHERGETVADRGVVARHAQSLGKADARQVVTVLAVALELRGAIRGVRPQRDVVPGLNEADGERGAPRAGPDDPDPFRPAAGETAS